MWKPKICYKAGSGMGGGGGSRSTASVVVDYGGGRRTEYRRTPDGRLFNETRGEVMNSRMSLDEVADRARNSGYGVETYNSRQTRERDAQRARENANRPDYELGVGMEDNRAYRRTARMNRLASRAMRRGNR